MRASVAEAPPGFLGLSLDDSELLVRPEAEEWARDAVEVHGTLHRAAGRSSDRISLVGRGVVYAVPAREGELERALGTAAGRWAVRHYRRGGWVAPFLGDRYLRRGEERPFRELRASEEVRSRRIPTPRVIAAAVYPAGIFYRGDLVTEFVPDSSELAEILFDHRRRDVSGSVDRREALTETGALIRRMAGAGVHHVDLNARNVLVEWSGRAPRAHLLDLDRCKISEGADPKGARSMRDRLRRSIRKLEKKSGLQVTDGELKALDRGLQG